MDAEYFQPKYQQALSTISKSGEKIRDVAFLAKRPFYPKKTENEFHYIEIGDLQGDGTTLSNRLLIEEAPSRAQWRVHPNDVITSTVRPLRRLSALIDSTQDDCVCSSGFAVLEPYNIEPEVLLVYLRLPLICEILDQYTTAAMYPALSTKAIENFPIPYVSSAVRTVVTEKVRAALQAKKEASDLLVEAKSRIEGLIMEGI